MAPLLEHISQRLAQLLRGHFPIMPPANDPLAVHEHGIGHRADVVALDVAEADPVVRERARAADAWD